MSLLQPLYPLFHPHISASYQHTSVSSNVIRLPIPIFFKSFSYSLYLFYHPHGFLRPFPNIYLYTFPSRRPLFFFFPSFINLLIFVLSVFSLSFFLSKYFFNPLIEPSIPLSFSANITISSAASVYIFYCPLLPHPSLFIFSSKFSFLSFDPSIYNIIYHLNIINHFHTFHKPCLIRYSYLSFLYFFL